VPSLVLDLDAEHLLPGVVVPTPYDAVHALLRWRGVPVGAAWLVAEQGVVSRARLEEALVHAAQPRIDELRVKAWLRQASLCGAASSASPLPRMSVAICTRDRPTDLARCLAAVCALPADGQEVLVVDSASRSDSTRDVVALYPGVRYLRLDEPGLDRARNRALRAAHGEVVAFIDDDAVPDAAWLRALQGEFADDRVLGVTGLAAPLELETPAQEWFERTNGFSRGFTRTVFDGASDDAFFVARIGAGVNMALRRDVLQRVGSFDEVLGAGTPTKAGDEHDMFSRILAAGFCMIYQPAAMVRHRHRREWSELHDAVRGYGTGVYAYLTRQLLTGESRAPYVAARWLGAQLRDVARGALSPAHRTRAALVLSELAGCAVGPFAYLRTRGSGSSPDIEAGDERHEFLSDVGAAVPDEGSRDAARLPHITVVIPTHNRRDRIAQLVTMLSRADYPSAKLEVIVVANGCTDDTVTALRALTLPPAFQVVELPHGGGAATARNRGASLARGELLLFLDDDIEPSASLLARHAACFLEGDDRVLIGAPIPVRRGTSATMHEIAMWSWWEARLARMSDPGYRFAYDDLFTGVVSMPLSLFTRVGGFDEAFACREDSELGMRLLAAGAQFRFSRSAGGLHHELRNPARLAARKRAEGRADVQLARKHAALWPALRIAWPLQPWWTPLGAVRRLARTSGTERLMRGVLEPLLGACERVRARGSWRALHGALAYYWYWRGVADTIGHEPLQLLQRQAAAAATQRTVRVMAADLADGALAVAQRLDAERPDAARLSFGGVPVGQLPARSGAEPLRGAHLCAALVRDHASALAHLLAPAGDQDPATAPAQRPVVAPAYVETRRQ